jgi:hypothetical protein
LKGAGDVDFKRKLGAKVEAEIFGFIVPGYTFFE